MARRLDRIIVIDVESTCWAPGQQPSGHVSEIIEIGVAALDVESLETVETESILVRPTQSQVSEFCTQLTTLTPDQVADGIAFAEACRHLRKRYSVDERTWASYGDYDRTQFQRQCAAQGVRYPFGSTHLNVKSLFALTMRLHREIGMADALARLNLGLIGTHHRGGDDARNIAAILANLLSAARAGGAPPAD